MGLVKLLEDFKYTINLNTETPLELNAKNLMLDPKSKVFLNVERIL